ncbi:MAG TPA: protein-glutamate O-methyltransferase [Steroidobacteraceae bacterium]|jgi:chemotaxis protein methyltransferase CheR
MAGAADSALLREYELSDDDFQRIRRLVRERLGIALAQSKRELVYGRLSRRLRALKMRDFASYLKCVEDRNGDELQHFCNAITTNLTSFFRESHHFDFLARLMPALERRNANCRRLRFWSAGCSTGEEAYSIAMVVQQHTCHLRDWNIRVLATDIDTNVLAHARRGHYHADRLEKMDPERVRRWFESTGDERQFVVREELRQLVSFKTLNLIDSWPMKGPIDVIFCRNVVIYFDREIQRQIVARMASLQRIDDHLIVGHSESLLHVSKQYRLVGDTIHRRIDA